MSGSRTDAPFKTELDYDVDGRLEPTFMAGTSRSTSPTESSNISRNQSNRQSENPLQTKHLTSNAANRRQSTSPHERSKNLTDVTFYENGSQSPKLMESRFNTKRTDCRCCHIYPSTSLHHACDTSCWLSDSVTPVLLSQLEAHASRRLRDSSEITRHHYFEIADEFNLRNHNYPLQRVETRHQCRSVVKQLNCSYPAVVDEKFASAEMTSSMTSRQPTFATLHSESVPSIRAPFINSNHIHRLAGTYFSSEDIVEGQTIGSGHHAPPNQKNSLTSTALCYKQNEQRRDWSTSKSKPVLNGNVEFLSSLHNQCTNIASIRRPETYFRLSPTSRDQQPTFFERHPISALVMYDLLVKRFSGLTNSLDAATDDTTTVADRARMQTLPDNTANESGNRAPTTSSNKLFRPYLDLTTVDSGNSVRPVSSGLDDDESPSMSSTGVNHAHALRVRQMTSHLGRMQMKKYCCDLCGRKFSRSNTLVTHRRIHTGEKPFTCDVCGRAFRQPGNLTRHRVTHTTHRPHACHICSRAFNRVSNLQTHMRIHRHQ